MKFGELLKSYRKRRGLSQSRMAVETGISRSNIVQIEKGKWNPRLELAVEMMSFLDIPITKLNEVDLSAGN